MAPRSRRAVRWAVAVLAAAGLVACGGAKAHVNTASAAAAVPGSAGATATPTPQPDDPAAGFRSPRNYPGVAPPVHLRIPAIGVDTDLERLGLDRQGAIEAPHRWQEAGWFAEGPRPGQAGPAVLLGHVDSRSGPAVFYRLAFLRPGDAVYVRRSDGTTARFRVTGRQQVAKSRFPSDLVYGATLQPSLRLVTCGGSFDAHSGHYRDNVIVTAVPS